MKHCLTLAILLFLATGCSRPKILFEADKTSLTTSIYAVVQTGSLADDPKRAGEAKLLGELMLRGTKSKSTDEFQKAIEQIGGSISSTVSMDTITVFGTVITENADAFLDLLDEAITEPAFTEEEFKKLKVETLAEINHTKNRNTRIGGLALRKTIFEGTVIERPSNGSLTTVNAITREDLVKRHQRDFNQKNVFFAAASSLNERKIKERLTTTWKKLPKGSKTKLNYATPKFPEKPKIVVVHKPNSATGSILMGREGITVDSPDRYTVGVANFSFGGEPLVSRLFKTVRGQLGYTYSIGSTYSGMGSLTKQRGLYIIYSTPAIEFTAKTLFKTFSMWADYRTKGVTSDELALARDSLINSYPFEFESAKKRLWTDVGEFLYGVPTLKPDAYRKKINSIDNKLIQETISRLHGSRGWVITIVADKDIIAKQLEEAQKDIAESERLKIANVMTPDEVIH